MLETALFITSLAFRERIIVWGWRKMIHQCTKKNKPRDFKALAPSWRTELSCICKSQGSEQRVLVREGPRSRAGILYRGWFIGDTSHEMCLAPSQTLYIRYFMQFHATKAPCRGGYSS